MIFLNFASSAAALVLYLLGGCTHTDTERKQRKTRVRNILKSSKKNTIFNEHLVTYRNLVIRKLFLFPIYIFHHSIGCHLTENTFFSIPVFEWSQDLKSFSGSNRLKTYQLNGIYQFHSNVMYLLHIILTRYLTK